MNRQLPLLALTSLLIAATAGAVTPVPRIEDPPRANVPRLEDSPKANVSRNEDPPCANVPRLSGAGYRDLSSLMPAMGR